MKFLNDYQIKDLDTRKELQDAVDFYKEHDVWIFPYAHEIQTFGVSDYPLFNGNIRENVTSCDDAALDECLKEAGLFLTVPTETSQYVTFATRSTALTSIYDRSGTNCRIVRTINSTPKMRALSAEERGEIINKGWKTSDEQVKMLISDEKISFVGSSKYVILPYDEGIRIAENVLDMIFDKKEYIRGHISHEFIVAEWEVSSAETEAYRIFLEEHHIVLPTQSVSFRFQFSSSNIGNAKMSGRILILVDGRFLAPLGLPSSVWHLKGHSEGCSLDVFETKLFKIASSIQNNEDQIELLGNTDIYFPAGCLQHVLKLCPTIPKKLKDLAVENMKKVTSCNAVDIYFAVSELIEKMHGSRSLILATEEAAKLQFITWEHYDQELEVE